MKRFKRATRRTLAKRVFSVVRRVTTAPVAMATAGGNDSKYFEASGVVHLAMQQEDMTTIAAALLNIGAPDTMELFERLPTLMVRPR